MSTLKIGVVIYSNRTFDLSYKIGALERLETVFNEVIKDHPDTIAFELVSGSIELRDIQKLAYRCARVHDWETFASEKLLEEVNVLICLNDSELLPPEVTQFREKVGLVYESKPKDTLDQCSLFPYNPAR